MRDEREQSESLPFFAISAEKEEEKMTHLRQTTSYPQALEIQQYFCRLIGAVIEEEAINPCPMSESTPTSVLARLGVYALPRGGVFSDKSKPFIPRTHYFAQGREISWFSSGILKP